MKFVRSDNRFWKYRYATIVRAGDVVDVTYHKEHLSTGIQKLNAQEYMVLSTGEILNYNATGETKADTLDQVRESMRELMRTVNANDDNIRNKGLWVTLTYAENMTDQQRLRKDMAYLMLKLRKKYGPLVYIKVKEPQERGAWHMHLFIWKPKPKHVAPVAEMEALWGKATWQESKLYIPKDELEKLWGHGFAKVKRVEDVDNIGAYLTAYLTNIKDGEKTRKGARLNLYPKGMRIWDCSRGVERPVVEKWKPPNRVRSLVGTTTPCYAPSPVEIYGDDGRLLDVVRHEQYNMKRTGSKDKALLFEDIPKPTHKIDRLSPKASRADLSGTQWSGIRSARPGREPSGATEPKPTG